MQRTAAIHIVDPDPGTAAAVRGLFASQAPQLRTYRTAADFRDGRDNHRPACVICELTLPDQCGIELVQQIRGGNCPLPVIVLAERPTVRATVDAMIAGAMFVLEKPADSASLQKLISGAIQKDADRMLRCQDVRQLKARFELLSPREREVAEHIFRGLETKAVAARLGISPKTVEYHRAQIFAKMEVSNAVQLTVALLKLEQIGH